MKSQSPLKHATKTLLFFTGLATAFSISVSAQTPALSLYEKYKDTIQNSHFKNYQININKLPNSGHWKHQGWSGTYLPAGRGGLIGNYADFSSTESLLQVFEIPKSNPRDERTALTKLRLSERIVQLLDSQRSTSQMATSILSEIPSVKFDLLNNTSRYPLTRIESERVSKEKNHNWAGMCNGWATAVALHPNLKDFQSNTPVGEVKFSANDTAKLLTWYYFFNPPQAQMFDRLCNPMDRKACSGMNPAVFHVLVTNIIGLQKNVVLADVDSGPAVFNHPLIQYEMTEFQKIDPKDYDQLRDYYNIKVKKQHSYYVVEMKVVYLSETSSFTSDGDSFKEYIRYILETNSSGEILDGHTMTQSPFPDVIYRVFPTEPTAGWKKFFDELKKNGM